MWKSVSAVVMAAGFAGGIVALIVIAADKVTDRSGYSGPAASVQTMQSAADQIRCPSDYSHKKTGRYMKTGTRSSSDRDEVVMCYRQTGTEVEIGGGTQYIIDNAFQNKDVTGVVIKDSVVGIGRRAFYRTPLKYVIIGNKVEHIGGLAFRGTQLTRVTIPDSVTKIDDMAFYSTQLEFLRIGKKVEYIGERAFDLTNLGNLWIGKVCIPNENCQVAPTAFPDAGAVCDRETKKKFPKECETYKKDCSAEELRKIECVSKCTNVEGPLNHGCGGRCSRQ